MTRKSVLGVIEHKWLSLQAIALPSFTAQYPAFPSSWVNTLAFLNIEFSSSNVGVFAWPSTQSFVKFLWAKTIFLVIPSLLLVYAKLDTQYVCFINFHYYFLSLHHIYP